jgi:hypothetical protein
MTIRLAAALLVLSTSTLSAQELAGRPQEWGTASDSIHTIQAFAFDQVTGGGTNVTTNGYRARFCTSTCGLVASVTIPAGVSLRGLELEACDVSSSATVTATLYRATVLEQALTTLATVTTGSAATPGCDFFGAPLNHTVENLNGSYVVEVTINGINADTRFQAVRLFYRLQVSPAPATATFADVPVGDPIHRFVEALAAAGITGGCGGGNFCPGAPLTRGQMAVFLATALGLHFPN